MLFLAILLGLLLDVDVDAGRQIDAHECVNGLRRRVEDVDKPLVRTHLEVLPRVFVLMRGPDDAIHVLLGRQRHWTHHTGAGTRARLNDLARRGVNRLVVVGLEPDADLLSRHASPTSLLLRTSAGPLRTWSLRFVRVGWPHGSSAGVAAAVYLSEVHRSPRSGVSPARALRLGGNSAFVEDGTVCARLGAGCMPGQAQTRLKATRTVCLRTVVAPNPWPWDCRGGRRPCLRRRDRPFLLQSKV